MSKRSTRTAVRRTMAAKTPPVAPPQPRPTAGEVLNAFLAERGIALVPVLSVERTEGGKMIVGTTVGAAYLDELQQAQRPAVVTHSPETK